MSAITSGPKETPMNPAVIARAQNEPRAAACCDCGNSLTPDEAKYLEVRCNACESIIHENSDREEMGIPPSTRLVLPYPISANRYWATRVIPAKGARKAMAITYVTSEAEAFKQQVRLLALQAGVRKPITGRVRLTLELYPHRPLDWAKRARKDPDYWADTVQCIDLGNCEKVLSDALNGIAWEDDKHHHEIHKFRRDPDEHGARVVVTITPIAHEPVAPGLFA